MDKQQAIHNFWSTFGTAYDENAVPDSAELPYITYSVSTDSMGQPITLTASLWENSSSWASLTDLSNRIAEYIGVGGRVIPLDEGYMWICRGTPFSQRVASDEGTAKRIYIVTQAEFLTKD